MSSSRSNGRRDPAVAIGAPLTLLAVVYGMWLAIDVIGQIGPLDKATLGWATVMPLWFASPALAALLWGRLPSFVDRLAAGIVGAILFVAATGILWFAVVTENAGCENGPRSTPVEFLLPAALIGVIVGGGWTFSSLVAASLVREGRPWWGLGSAVVVGVIQFGLVAITFAFVAFTFAGCNRPS